MLNKNFMLKIIAVLIIQAMFLTQVDYSLAATYQSKERIQEAALRVNNFQETFTSLVIGLACIYQSHQPIKKVLELLKGYGTNITEIIKTEEVCVFSKHIYKVFTIDRIVQNQLIVKASLIRGANKDREQIEQLIAVQKRGPPEVVKQLKSHENRTV